MELGVRSQVVRRHALHEHRSSRLGIDLAWYRDGLGRFDDHVVSEAALATAEPPDPLPFVEVGDLRSDLHDQAYALDPSQIRQGDGTDASQRRPCVPQAKPLAAAFRGDLRCTVASA